MLDLPLPEVAAAHAQVNFDDTRCFGNAASRSVPEAAWRKLEAPLTGGESSVGAGIDRISLHCVVPCSVTSSEGCIMIAMNACCVDDFKHRRFGPR